MNIGKENEKIEFKKATSELKEGLRSISAILNKNGNGSLYFGVKDNGDVIGQQIGSETLRDISRDIRNLVKPECEFVVEKKLTDDGKTFIEVIFNGDNAPYSADGKYYLRFHDEDRIMTNKELETYFKSRIVNYSDWENNDSCIEIKDLDLDLLVAKIKKGNDNGRIPSSIDNIDTFLKKTGLINKNGNLNNACEVLFSKNKPILLKLATYATNTKDTFLKLEHFQGNIFECLEKAISYVLSGIEWKIIIDGNLERKELPEIPQKALREIVINAFCHGKYNSNTAFEINIFKDRVTIYSPGFFPNGYTPEDFAYEHEEPIMLNPKIIGVLFKTCEIESFGYGFDTTFKECKNNNVKYEYKTTKSGFKFTFYRPLGQKYVQDNLSKTEIAVLMIVKGDNYIRANKISEKINKSTKTIYRALAELKRKGYIKRIGDDYNGYWEVIDKQ